MANYRMELAYDGSTFDGWQRLSDSSNTIQGTIEKYLSEFLSTKIKIIGSGRTDKGVHAHMQVANFHTTKAFDIEAFLHAIHQSEQERLIIASLTKVDDDFHSRFNANRKSYEYVIEENGKWSPYTHLYAYQLIDKLDVDAMKLASEKFVGRHDFRAFTSMKDESKDCHRTIDSIIIKEEKGVITIEISGDGFLYNMVRIIVGTLIEIGMGKRKSSTIDSCFKNGIRQEAGYLVPPNGLFLKNVEYNEL